MVDLTTLRECRGITELDDLVGDRVQWITSVKVRGPSLLPLLSETDRLIPVCLLGSGPVTKLDFQLIACQTVEAVNILAKPRPMAQGVWYLVMRSTLEALLPEDAVWQPHFPSRK